MALAGFPYVIRLLKSMASSGMSDQRVSTSLITSLASFLQYHTHHSHGGLSPQQLAQVLTSTRQFVDGAAPTEQLQLLHSVTVEKIVDCLRASGVADVSSITPETAYHLISGLAMGPWGRMDSSPAVHAVCGALAAHIEQLCDKMQQQAVEAAAGGGLWNERDTTALQGVLDYWLPDAGPGVRVRHAPLVCSVARLLALPQMQGRMGPEAAIDLLTVLPRLMPSGGEQDTQQGGNVEAAVAGREALLALAASDAVRGLKLAAIAPQQLVELLEAWQRAGVLSSGMRLRVARCGVVWWGEVLLAGTESPWTAHLSYFAPSI
jgi:hypothetical protein